MISLHNVAYLIGAKALVSDVSFEVMPGAVTALVGANGAGKSTSLKLMSGQWTPSKGDVRIDGQPVGEIPVDELALRRSVLSQQSALTFGFKVDEVVQLGRTPHGSSAAFDAEIASRAMEIAGVSHLKDRFYPTLSGGEQQRVHLARALAQIWEQPSKGERYLLLDEPTASLDLAHQHAVLETARDCADAGVGVFTILHDLNLAAQYADRIIVLHQGHMIADGSPADVLTPEIILKAYDMPVMVTPHPCASCPMVVPIPGRNRSGEEVAVSAAASVRGDGAGQARGLAPSEPEYPLPVI